MSSSDWALLSSHGLALVQLARHPDLRVREIAGALGLTERGAQRIMNDLVERGFVERIREGRRNRYVVLRERRLPHPITNRNDVADLVDALAPARCSGPGHPHARTVLLACGEHAHARPLRAFLASEGLRGCAEVVLWPGGASALDGIDGVRLRSMLVSLVRGDRRARLILAIHEPCSAQVARGSLTIARTGGLDDATVMVLRRGRLLRELGLSSGAEPELWVLRPGPSERIPYTPMQRSATSSAEAQRWNDAFTASAGTTPQR